MGLVRIMSSAASFDMLPASEGGEDLRLGRLLPVTKSSSSSTRRVVSILSTLAHAAIEERKVKPNSAFFMCSRYHNAKRKLKRVSFHAHRTPLRVYR